MPGLRIEFRHARVASPAAIAAPRRQGAVFPARRGVARPPPRAPVILVYHHLAAAPCRWTDLLGVTTDPDVFRRHMRHVARHFDLIAPDDLLHGRLPARPLLVTFDDAYRSVLDIGGTVLREFGVQSIFFLNPAVIAGDLVPLDNLLCLAMQALGPETLGKILGTSIRTMADAALRAAAQLSPQAVVELRATICQQLGSTESALRLSSDLFLRPEDVPLLAASGIEAANHSMSHPFLRRLARPALAMEIGTAKDRIEAMSSRAVRWFSIPYGDARDATPDVLDIARSSGHSGIFLVQGRPNRARAGNDLFYRISPRNIPAPLLPISLRVLPELRLLRHAMRTPPA